MKGLLEVGHFHCVGTHWREAYELLKDMLTLVHVKDQVARKSGWQIHHHVTGDGAIDALRQDGFLGPDVTLIHCSNTNDSDAAAIASAGSSVVLTPAAEMAGGMGSPPIQRLIDNGIRPGLGVGSESTAPGDMFAQMRATNSIQHASMFDLKLSGKSGLPQLLTTREVIKYATIDSAAAIGLAGSIGSLEPGKHADIVVLRTDLPNIHPVNDPIGAVVWGMDTSNVGWVFVGGEPVVRDGALVSGNARARDLAVTAQRRLVGEISGYGGAV
jgi:cytosine/adenosine deaminase-related metal-dependent hydrolase